MPELNRMYREQKVCRACGGPLQDIMDLGDQAVVDFPLPDDTRVTTAPLQIKTCIDCELGQLGHTVHPDALYRNYFYRSSTNGTMRANLEELAASTLAFCPTAAGDVVLDIGANDGYLLSQFPENMTPIGFDPAQNMPAYRGKISEYFTYWLYARLGLPLAKIVTSVAMLYDVDDPVRFARDVSLVLHPEGLWVIQMNYLPDILRKNAVDFFSHEHVTLWSLSDLWKLLKMVGMDIAGVQFSPLNGGTFRVYAVHAQGLYRYDDVSGAVLDTQQQVTEALSVEYGVKRAFNWATFEAQVAENARNLRTMLRGIKAAGQSAMVYGASTRGNTLLQVAKVAEDLVAFAADRDPNKWGRRMVGTAIRIISEERARDLQPDYFLILPYSYLSEFAQRERAFLERGGKFIVPVPEPRILGAEDLLAEVA